MERCRSGDRYPVPFKLGRCPRCRLRDLERLLAAHLGLDEPTVTESASFNDLGVDSLEVIELVMAFEEEFGCEIPDDAAEEIVTVKDAIDSLEGA